MGKCGTKFRRLYRPGQIAIASASRNKLLRPAQINFDGQRAFANKERLKRMGISAAQTRIISQQKTKNGI